MTITFTIADDLYDRYKAEAKAKTEARGVRVTTEQVIVGRLRAAESLDPDRRTLIVLPPQLQVLEAKLGGGHLLSGTQLVDRVNRLARIGFGDYEIALTPSQYEEIAFRAGKQGRTVEQMLMLTWQRMQDDFFNRIP